MKKSVIIILVVLAVVILISLFYITHPQKLDFGKSCGDIHNKTFSDSCCANRNVNSEHLDCIGNWTFIEGKARGALDECQYICK